MSNELNLNVNITNAEEYQKILAQKSAEILGNNKSITLNELKNKPIFQEALKNLNEEQLKKVNESFKKVANTDGKTDINKDELQTILALMDGKYDEKGNQYDFDGKFDIDEKSGILRDDIGESPKKMSRKEAQQWVEKYMEETGCKKKEAKEKFKEVHGYDIPPNFWGKIGKGFKAVGEALLGIIMAGAIAIPYGNSAINGDYNKEK